jgi:hypothetical protein
MGKKVGAKKIGGENAGGTSYRASPGRDTSFLLNLSD